MDICLLVYLLILYPGYFTPYNAYRSAYNARMSRALLITGATGNQGGAVIDALLAKGSLEFLILAATRDSKSPAAQRLAAKSPAVKLVEGDMDSAHALFAAARSIAAPVPLWGVYSVQVFSAKGASLESEIRQGKAMVDQAINNGIHHFVYSSVERGGDERSWKNRTPVPHFQTKYTLENYLRESVEKTKSTMSWTILRPSMFMDNLEPTLRTKVFLSMLRDIMGETPLQWVAVKDIGIAVVQAFSNPEEWEGKSVGLVSEVLTFSELDRAFQKATGRPVETSYKILGKALKYGLPGVPQYGVMTKWLAEEGFKADLEKNKGFNPNLTTLEAWLADSPFTR